MQMEPVSYTKKPRRLVAFFVDANGNKISYDVPLIANVRDTDARKRVMNEKFILKSGKYRRNVRLHYQQHLKRLHREITLS